MINNNAPSILMKNELAKSTLMKKKLTHNILRLSSLVLAIATAPTLYAASDDDTPWYQVNIIIFERIHSSENEYWPKDQVLTYPKNITFLTTQHSNSAPQTKTINDEEAPYTQTQSVTEQSHSFISEQPFTLLEEEKGLQDTAKRIRNTRNYRVLFHESWRQPLQALNKSPAILIKGGDKFDDKHALNGTITLGIGRYLHARANLWLTEFEANFGQETGAWPALPQLPSNKAYIEKVRDGISDNNLNDSNLNDKNLNNTDSHTGLSHIATSQKQTRFDETNVDLNLDGSFKTQPFSNTGITFGNNSLGNTSPIDNIINERYVIKNITTLNQTRRMRSNEIHYIDHPKFGVIVNMTRYERPKAPEEKPQENNPTNTDNQNIKVTIPTPSLGF